MKRITGDRGGKQAIQAKVLSQKKPLFSFTEQSCAPGAQQAKSRRVRATGTGHAKTYNTWRVAWI